MLWPKTITQVTNTCRDIHCYVRYSYEPGPLRSHSYKAPTRQVGCPEGRCMIDKYIQVCFSVCASKLQQLRQPGDKSTTSSQRKVTEWCPRVRCCTVSGFPVRDCPSSAVKSGRISLSVYVSIYCNYAPSLLRVRLL